MAGTRTAPAVNGTAQYKSASFSLVDASGDIRSVTLRVPAAATNAQIEAVGAALQAATSASVWKIEVQDTYEGSLATSNAEAEFDGSVFDNISIGFRDIGTGATQTAYIPAPVPALVGEGDDVDIEAALFTAYRDAVDTALAANYTPRYTRFTERREINPRKPAGS